jgi:hypothetical protein
MLSTIVRSLVCAVALLALMTTPANAQPLDKRVIFTFSAPVVLPGVTLPAGTYLFRVPTPNRNIIQVLNGDGTKIYGTFFAISAHRNVRPENPEVRFMETAATKPHAIRTWWYPGDSTGFEFIYPKEQARLLAKNSSESVLTTKAQTTTTAQTETDQLTRISSSGQETAVDANAKPTASNPIGEMEGGTVASPTMVIPSNPAPVKIDD